jgi:hypothetical protein
MLSLRLLERRSRWAVLFLAGLLVAAALIASLPALRYPALRAVGWMLVAEDPPAKADVVVISSDALGAGILEAADLVHAGYASRVAIFDRPVTGVSRELARRGAQPFDLRAISIQMLQQLGITDVLVMPVVVGTVDEGKVLHEWCAAHDIHSILFVSVRDHSRRTRRVLDRALVRHGVQVIVRYARFSDFDPDSWWQSRGGQRVEAVETEKLLMDYLLHPF